MAKTNAFKIAELIRGIQFDVDNDEITTSKKVKSRECQKEVLSTLQKL